MIMTIWHLALDYIANLPLTSWLTAALIAVIVIAAVIIFRQSLKLRRKARDDGSWQKNIVALEERKRHLLEEQAEKTALAEHWHEKITEIAAGLHKAQYNCGLEEFLSNDAFIAWLRKREAAEKAQAEQEFLAERQAEFWQKVRALKTALLAYNEIVPFFPADSDDFTALLQAARQKNADFAARNAELARQEEALSALESDYRQKQAEAAALRKQAAALQQQWRQEVEHCFAGRMKSAALYENLDSLDILAEKGRQAGKALALYSARQEKINKQFAAYKEFFADTDNLPLRLDTVLAETERELEAVEERYRKSIEEKAAAETEWRAITGDVSLALLEQEKQTVMLEMQQCLEDYANALFAEKLARSALNKYRDIHRGSMMEASERAFISLTNGAYQALQTQTGSTYNQEILLAIDKKDKIKRAENMSKGTRFQLYMALRAAAYEQLLNKNITMPFFCDDIFETFDDERTRAACSLMRHIGQKGQAIYLTHHRHVVNIAKEICGQDVIIHTIN